MIGQEEAGRPPQPQPLHLPQQGGALLPGRFVWEGALSFQAHGGRSSTASSGRGRSAEGRVQGPGLVRGGAAGGAPAGLLVVGGGAGVAGGDGFSGTLVAVVAFALAAAGAVDGADVVAVSGSGRAVGQAEDVHGGVEAAPLSRPPVVGPVGADGAEVLLIAIINPAF